MARALKDSYTGEVASEYYTSIISGINDPKGLYKDKFAGSSASYRADKQSDGSFAISRCPQVARELPGYPLCSVADKSWANRILDWFVRHDGSMLVAIDRMTGVRDAESDFDTFFLAIEQAMRETITS